MDAARKKAEEKVAPEKVEEKVAREIADAARMKGEADAARMKVEEAVGPLAEHAVEGRAVTLVRRTKIGGPVRLATVAWNVQDPPGQSAEHFLATIAGARQSYTPCDLVVTAGLPVGQVPSASAVLASSNGVPVLFEAKMDSLHSWFLIHSKDGCGNITLVRKQQVVFTSDQNDFFPFLAEILSSGAGSIGFTETELKMVLFICGENNVLASTGRRSVLKAPPGREENREGWAELLSGPWMVLNPAHKPYYPQIKTTGFAKVGVVPSKDGIVAGPTLRRLVEARATFPDGTESPVAIVHINNFDAKRLKTADYADVAFGDTIERVRRVRGPTTGQLGNGNALWRCSVFDVQSGRHRTRNR